MEKTKKKRIITFTAIAAAVATLAVTLMTIFIPGAKNVAPVEPESTGNIVIDDSVSHGIKLSSYLIPQEEYEMYNVSPLAETAQQVTATITPSDATNKQLDWSVAWKNASSTWATGKTVTDYVTVTPSSDGATTATVTCLQGFSEKIILKATLRVSPSIYGTANIDYMYRVTGVSDFSLKVGDLFTISESSATAAFPFTKDTLSEYRTYTNDLTKSLTLFPTVVGTVSQSFTVTIKLNVADQASASNFTTVFQKAGYGSTAVSFVPITITQTYNGVAFSNTSITVDVADMLFLFDDKVGSSFDFYKFKKTFSENASSINFKLDVNFASANGDTYNYSVPFKFNASSEKFVESIDLGSSSIVF